MLARGSGRRQTLAGSQRAHAAAGRRAVLLGHVQQQLLCRLLAVNCDF